eukprot:SAG31_NODE_1936_length_6871_cov_3.385854_5_plen_460_part_00
MSALSALLSLMVLVAATTDAVATPVLKVVKAGRGACQQQEDACNPDGVPAFALERSTVAALTGSGFAASATATRPLCRLTPSGGTSWTYGGEGALYVNLTVLNDTHAECTTPNSSSNGLTTPFRGDRRACHGDGSGLHLPCKGFAEGKLCNDTTLIGVGSRRDSVGACYDWCAEDSGCRYFGWESDPGYCIRYSAPCRLRTTDDPSYTVYQLEGNASANHGLANELIAAPFVEGPGTIAVSVDGQSWSNGLPIEYANLFSVALGRRPYIGELSGHLVFTSSDCLLWEMMGCHSINASLTVEAFLPAAGKTWTWLDVPAGTDELLPLDFDGLPPRLHNDMSISVTVHQKPHDQHPDDETFTVWRRFMRVPPPDPGSGIEAVQLDATRGGILTGGKPFLGRGYYINRLNNNESIPAVRTNALQRPHHSIASEVTGALSCARRVILYLRGFLRRFGKTPKFK